MRENRSKLMNFTKALLRLEEGLGAYKDDNTLLRDGIIQRFEFTFELAWKSMKEVFEDEGLIGLNSPKAVLKEAFAIGIIMDEKLWINMLSDRNATSHIYSESVATEICNNIINKYFIELIKLKDVISKKID